MIFCFINPTKRIRPGTVNLINSLSKKNKIFLLTPKKVEDPFKSKNVKIIIYPSLFIPKIRYTIPNFIKQYRILKKIIKKEKVDFIHCWSYFYPVNFMPLILSKKRKVPIVSTIDTFPGINWSYGSSFIVDMFSKFYSRTIGKYVLKKMDAIVLMGEYLKLPAKEIGIENPFVIQNSIDIDRFNIKQKRKLLREFSIKKNEIVLLNVGRLVPVKDIESIIKLSKELLAKGYKIKTLIVGDGPYGDKYKKNAKNVKEIVYSGFRKDVQDIMSISDIFLLSSVSEGLPSAVIEASASGLSVVSTNVGGVGEIIKNNESGYIVNSYREMLNKTEMLVKSKKLRKKISKRAKIYARKEFNQSLVLKKYEKVYSKLIVK